MHCAGEQLSQIAGFAVQLLKLCVVDFIFECAFYRAQVDSGRLWDLGSMYTNDKDSRWIVTLPIVTRPHE
jgi:hypothetical protein